MKTIKHIIFGVVILTTAFSGFTLSFGQSEPLFFETFRSDEITVLMEKDDPFFRLVDRSETVPESSKLGICKNSDVQTVMEHLENQGIRKKLPEDVRFAWGRSGNDGSSALYALKVPPKKRVLRVSEIKSVNLKENEESGSYDILISFNGSGTDKWARMTRENVGRDIAIIVNGKVISSPRVQDEIKFGKCRISGDLNEKEAAEIKKMLEK